MSNSFDPYHKWLGISPKDQPPNHYRLLGIDVFEADPDVIASAADQRMAHVRAFQTGRHSALSQEILNEIAGARVCLLNAQRKAAYDRRLREQLGLAGGESAAVEEPTEPAVELPGLSPFPSLVPSPDETVAPWFEGGPPRRRWYGSKRIWQGVAAILVTALLFGAVWAMLRGGDSNERAQNQPGEKPATQPDKSDQPKPPSDQGTSTAKQDVPGKEPAGKPKPDTPPEVIGPKTGVGPNDDQGNQPPQKLPVPEDSARAVAEAGLKPAFADASPAELLEAGRAEEHTPDERFVLFEMARDAAAATGDVETALEAVDEIAQRYEIDLLQMKAVALLTAYAGATTPAAFRLVAERGLELAGQAKADQQYDLAKRIAAESLAAARKSDDAGLINRATIVVMELQDLPQP
jgi:hypothetical protein